MRPDQERVRTLLTDTVTLLCKNGLQFSKELKVQGLLGITTDDNDVFVVHINERFEGTLVPASRSDAKEAVQSQLKSDSQHSIVRKRPLRDCSKQSGASVAKVRHTFTDDKPDLLETSEASSFDNDIQIKIENVDSEEEDVVLAGTTELDYDAESSSGEPSFVEKGSLPRKRSDPLDTGSGRQCSQISEFDRTLAEEQFAVEPSDAGWASVQGFGGGHEGPAVTGVDVTQVILAVPPEYLQSLPLGLEELSSTVTEAQNTQSFGQNPAAFLINKLLNMSFTKEEFARSRGIGKYLQVTHQQRLDPVKVQAVKDLLAFLCDQFGWEPLSSTLINHKFSQKCVHARHSAKGRKGGAQQH